MPFAKEMESVTGPSTFAKHFQQVRTELGVSRAGNSALQGAEKLKRPVSPLSPSAPHLSWGNTVFPQNPTVHNAMLQGWDGGPRWCWLAAEKHLQGMDSWQEVPFLSDAQQSAVDWLCSGNHCNAWCVWQMGSQAAPWDSLGCGKEKGTGIVPDCTGSRGLD